MKAKYTSLTDALYTYLCECRSNARDPVLEALRTQTEALGDLSRMQISREQGSFLTILTAALGARFAIEVGTFTGFSAICLARGLVEGGQLVAIDRSAEWTSIAKRFWIQAGVQTKIDLRLGEAISVLKNLDPNQVFDLAFIDGDKTEYDAYYELILPRLRRNGLVLFDNMLWGGRLGAKPLEDPDGSALDALNRKLSRDGRVQTVLLPIADGIQFCRKL
ncbi:MAG: class I SAM-dependent methyltransferase [Verrucomicrobia bacterium]|nr:class I SAM-dependent methyltransferase [Verrucomicrobiota bacterium]